MTRGLVAIATLLCSTLAACSTAAQSIPHADPAALRAKTGTPLMYLFDGHVPPVAIDEVPLSGGAPAARIRNGLTGPSSALVDKNGTLYVLNFTGAQYQILEYPSGALSPALTITTGVGYPAAMAVNASGELYVLNAGGPLVKYDSGSSTPAYATYRGLCKPASGASAASLTIDAFATVYALTSCRKGAVVQEYDGGVPRVARTIHLPASQLPIGMTADKTGRLYITYFDSRKSFRLGLAEYERGATTPLTSFAFGPQPKLGSGGSSPVIDEVTGRLYTTFGICTQVNSGRWHCAGYIFGFRRGLKTPVITITAPHLRLLTPPVFDASGNLYTEIASPRSPIDTIWRYSASGKREMLLLKNRALGLITVWPNADSASVVRSVYANVPEQAEIFLGEGTKRYERLGAHDTVESGDVLRH